MTANQPYEPMALLRFQVSMLSLAAALENPPVAGSDDPYVRLEEAERRIEF